MGRTSDADVRLKDAALALIWEENYGSVTIDDICTKADVKKGSFYYFYKSKADLAVAALENMWLTETKNRLDTMFSSSVDPLQRLRAYCEHTYHFQLERQKISGRVIGCPVCSVGSELGTQQDQVTAMIRELMARKRRYFESAIRDAVAEGLIAPCDPAQKALAISGLVEGILAQARIMNDPEVIKGLTAMVYELLHVKATSAV